jgi:hypothetical protein
LRDSGGVLKNSKKKIVQVTFFFKLQNGGVNQNGAMFYSFEFHSTNSQLILSINESIFDVQNQAFSYLLVRPQFKMKLIF